MPALELGSVWDLRARPIPNVEVTLKGHQHHGVLTRDWSTDWVLIDEKGGELRFHDYDAMAFHPPATQPPLRNAWRSMVPVYVVAFAALAIAFGGVLSRQTSTR
jgi:hypothetical protein